MNPNKHIDRCYVGVRASPQPTGLDLQIEEIKYRNVALDEQEKHICLELESYSSSLTVPYSKRVGSSSYVLLFTLNHLIYDSF